jgi:acetyl-CoA carboxylase carboxyltransferase component
MYEQIMKFGAYIVDGLREYNQPILIYIPPNGELRGGAWAVVDTTINPRHMEMYADPESRFVLRSYLAVAFSAKQTSAQIPDPLCCNRPYPLISEEEHFQLISHQFYMMLSLALITLLPCCSEMKNSREEGTEGGGLYIVLICVKPSVIIL